MQGIALMNCHNSLWSADSLLIVVNNQMGCAVCAQVPHFQSDGIMCDSHPLSNLSVLWKFLCMHLT